MTRCTSARALLSAWWKTTPRKIVEPFTCAKARREKSTFFLAKSSAPSRPPASFARWSMENAMAEIPAYVILGRGRWAARMQSILAAENRRVESVGETRRAMAETDAAYRSRLAKAMGASGAQIAWLCVLPGPHIPLLIEAALDAG